MDIDSSLPVLRVCKEAFREQNIFRPLRIRRYDPGDELAYEVTGIVPANKARVKLEVEKFIGGGYAGQVYKVKLLTIQGSGGRLEGLEEGKTYALKILTPASSFARWFRNIIYAIAFQGPFSPQVNPAASRAGALWQKFIRRGAGLRFNDEKTVVDIHATFIDSDLGSCGEISEWIDGRMWRLESDDNLDARKRWREEKQSEEMGSPEYSSKRTFMAHLVELMHDMGAYELARQYEWWTCKSQPNALKRLEEDKNPTKGNVAVDFRAGLALLPFLPMCPADFRLIFQGVLRGSLVQFDRGDTEKLQRFITQHSDVFHDMDQALVELLQAEKSYRSSLPDITHNRFKLLTSGILWSNILKSSLGSWRIRNLIDQENEAKLELRKLSLAGFYLLGLIPLLGNFLRRVLGHAGYRKHWGHLITSYSYLRRTGRARIAEAIIRWYRSGRVDERQAKRISESSLRFCSHLPLSVLPSKVHRFFSDRKFARQALDHIFIRPFRLYFKASARERWLKDMVSRGQGSGSLTSQEASHIQSQIMEPFIQKYLKSLAVHVCTVPVTQIVSVLVAIMYVRLHPDLSWQEASLHAGLILGLFQVTPISPGSLVRGLYVTFLVLRERNFKDYNIAFCLSFFKYIGYLAFPIQMAYRYPDLARFMAGHWATGAVHIVPVFGEHGALMEHAVFDAFYNYPLTVRRRLQQRKRQRSGLNPRSWHVPVCVLGGSTGLLLLDLGYFQLQSHVPSLGDIWWLAIWIPALASAATAKMAGGHSLAKRISLSALSGALIGLIYACTNTLLSSYYLAGNWPTFMELMSQTGVSALMKSFLFTIVAIMGVIFIETRRLPNRMLD
jgi:hypothetical protein